MAPGSRGCTAKYILVATFTWLSGQKGGDDLEQEVQPAPADAEDLPARDEEELHQGEQPADEAVHPEDMGHGDDGLEEEEELEGELPQGEVHRLAVPMESKFQDVILKTISEIYLLLRTDGFVVKQLHSDRGGEFLGQSLHKWCRARDIVRTFTPGADPKVNGRAERAVMEVKNRIRAMIHGAGVSTSWWPIACRNLNERWRMQRIKRSDQFPPFMEEVLMKRRFWAAGGFDPTHEKVRYLCPSWADHGHWVLRPDGSKALTRSVIRNTTWPVSDEIWVGMADDLEPHEVGRRLRGKTTFRKMMNEEDPKPDEHHHVEKVIQEEMEALISDEHEVAQLALGGILRLCEFINQDAKEVDQVLQTKIISPVEVLKNKEEWKAAIQAEIDSLFDKKQALKVISSREAKQIMESQDVQAVPSKVVFTVKPDLEKVGGKKKCRIVACGNFAREEEDQDLFASGADSTSLRMALSLASRMRWEGANLDIRTAFLNAPMKHAGGLNHGEMELKKVLLRPAGILVKMGFFSPDEYWEVLRAVYGFRQSPKLWSDYRDDIMREMRVGDTRLVQMESEPAMWTIRHRTKEGIFGVVVTYMSMTY